MTIRLTRFRQLMPLLFALIAVSCTEEGLDKSKENSITDFKFNFTTAHLKEVFWDDVEYQISERKIEITVPYGTNLRGLPAILKVSKGATVSPRSGELQNYVADASRKFIVTSENGDKKEYNVIVRVNTNTQINSFKLNFPKGTLTQSQVINEVSSTISGNNITVSVPFGTSLVNLTSDIALSKKSFVNPKATDKITYINGIAREFNVTSFLGEVRKYLVTVNVRKNPAAIIDSMRLDFGGGVSLSKAQQDQIYYAFDYNRNRITASNIPVGTSISSVGYLVRVSRDATIEGAVLASDITPSNNTTYFLRTQSNSVYTNETEKTIAVTAANGRLRNYSLILQVNDNKNITKVDLDFTASQLKSEYKTEIDYSIIGTNITVNVPFEAKLKDVRTNISVQKDMTVSPVSGRNVTYTNGTAQIFTVTNPADNTSKAHRITVRRKKQVGRGKRISRWERTRDNVLTRAIDFKYNEQNLISEEILFTYNANTNVLQQASKTTFTYNSSNQIITRTTTSSENTETRTNYTYNDNGQITKAQIFVNDVASSTVAYSYDSEGRVTQKVTTNSSSNSEGTESYTYHSGTNNLHKINGLSILSNKVFAKYDDKNNPYYQTIPRAYLLTQIDFERGSENNSIQDNTYKNAQKVYTYTSDNYPNTVEYEQISGSKTFKYKVTYKY